MGSPTTNGMIAQRLDDLRDDLNRRFDEQTREMNYRFAEATRELAEVKVQTTETNGKVQKLQLWKARVEGMRAANAWLLPIVSSLLSGGGVSLVVLALTHHL